VELVAHKGCPFSRYQARRREGKGAKVRGRLDNLIGGRVKLRRMQNRTKYLIAGLLLGLLPLRALAMVPGDAFVAETKVVDEGSETRNTALTELLATVLVRVSGNTGIAGQPAAREILAGAPSLVQQYQYRTAEEGGKLARYLWARFDQASVERMMRERNLPVWVQRPPVLLWVATEQGGRRELLNLENQPEARAEALAAARQRGMPLQLPLMDLEDQTGLTPADLWSDYQPAIRLASARYPHEMILVGRLSSGRGGQWNGAWTLIGEGGSQGFRTPARALGDTLALGIAQAQNLLAARFAPKMAVGRSSGTLVRFSDIHDLAAYGRLVTILERLEPVTRVALRHVQNDSFVFEFQMSGDTQDLVRALEGSGQLFAEPAPLRVTPQPPAAGGTGAAGAPAHASQPDVELYYRLVN